MENSALNKSSNYSQIEKQRESEEIEFLSAKLDIVKAKKYVESKTIGYLENNQFKKYSLFDSIDKFQIYGHGSFFYFYFLKFWSIVFLIMSIISIFPILLNFLGKGLKSKSEGNYLISSTIGNTKVNSVAAYKTGLAFIDNLSLSITILLYEIFDLAYSLVFFFSIIIFHYKIKKLEKKINENINSPSKNTLEITGFKTGIISKDEIFEFFQKIGFDLKEINFAYNFNGSVENLIKLANLNRGLLINQKLLNNKDLNEKSKNLHKKKIQSLDKEIMKELKKFKKKGQFESIENISLDNLRAIRIYATFTNINQKKSAQRAFAKEYSKICICCREKNHNYYFKDKKLRFKTPDYPDNIIWENIEYGWVSRILRIFFVLIVSLIVFIICIIIIFVLNAINSGINLDISQCGTNIITIEEVNRLNNWNLTNCFCQQQPLQNLIQNSNLINTCSSYLQFLALNYSISFGSSALIALITIILNILSNKFIEFIRSHSLSSQLKHKVLYGLFINFLTSFLIFFLLYQNIANFRISYYFNLFVTTYTNFSNFQIKSEFTEPDRNWYVEVGLKFLTTCMISIFLPFSEGFIYLIKKFFNFLKNKKSDCNEDYIEKIQPNIFELEISFARSLNLWIIGLICCGGMPVIIIFLFLYFVVSFWVNKYMFIFWTKIPPLYNSSLINFVRASLPYILLLHTLASVYMYGASDIFTDKLSLINISNITSGGINNFLSSNPFLINLRRFILLVVILALTILYIVYDILTFFLKNIFFCGSNKIEQFTKKDNNQIKTLQSYNILKNYDYKKLLYLKNESKGKIKLSKE